MKYILFIALILSFSLQGTPFPLTQHEQLTEENQQVLLAPFEHLARSQPMISFEGQQVALGKEPTLTVFGESYTATEESKQFHGQAYDALFDFLTRYQKVFINKRSMKTGKDPKDQLMHSMINATSTFYTAVYHASAFLAQKYKADHEGEATQGFLKELYDTHYASSFQQFQRMVLSVFSYMIQNKGVEISYPYGSFSTHPKTTSQTVYYHYFWDAHGPVPYATNDADGFVKMPYGDMIPGIPRTLAFESGKLVLNDALFLKRASLTLEHLQGSAEGKVLEEDDPNGIQSILIKPYYGYHGSNGLKTFSKSTPAIDLPGLSVEDDTTSFVGYGGDQQQNPSVSRPVTETDKDYSFFNMLLERKGFLLAHLPSEQDLELLYLEALDDILENPGSHQQDYKELLSLASESRLSLPSAQERMTKELEEEEKKEDKERFEQASIKELRAVRDQIRQNLLERITKASPAEDMRKKQIAEANRAANQKKRKGQKKKGHKGRATPHHKASSSSVTHASSAHQESKDPLEELRAEGRVKFKVLYEQINQAARTLGHRGSHFMNYIRHNLSRRGSHISVGDQTIAQPHGSGDSTVPANFINTFVEGIVHQFQSQGSIEE